MNKVERLQAAAIAAPGIRDTRPARKVHVWNPTTGQVVGTLNSREVARKVAERAKIELGTEGLKKVGECERCGVPIPKKTNRVLCKKCNVCQTILSDGDICGREGGRACPRCRDRKKSGLPPAPRIYFFKCGGCGVEKERPSIEKSQLRYCEGCNNGRCVQVLTDGFRCNRKVEFGAGHKCRRCTYRIKKKLPLVRGLLVVEKASPTCVEQDAMGRTCGRPSSRNNSRCARCLNRRYKSLLPQVGETAHRKRSPTCIQTDGRRTCGRKSLSRVSFCGRCYNRKLKDLSIDVSFIPERRRAKTKCEEIVSGKKCGRLTKGKWGCPRCVGRYYRKKKCTPATHSKNA